MLRASVLPDLTLQRMARVAAGATFALGLAGMLGWWLDLAWLRRWPGDPRVISPNAAFVLALCSLALLLLHGPGGRFARIAGHLLALATLAMSAAAIVRMSFNLDPGWLASPLHATPPGSTPRLPLNSALAAALTALGILALAHERRHWFGLSNWLGLAVISFATIHLASALLATAPDITRMAAFTATGYLALGAALLAARAEGSLPRVFSRQDPVGYLALPLFGTGLIVPLLLYLLQIWWFVPIAPELHDTCVLVATVQGIAVLGMLTFALRRMDRIDVRRREAESARDMLLARLQQQASTLELLVGERTQELRKTTERLDLALRAGGFGVWDWDLTGRSIYWDPRQCSLYGYTPAEFDGTKGAWLQRLHHDDRAAIEAEVAQALAGAEHFENVFRIVLPDGTERHIQSHGFVRRDEQGQVVRVVGMDRDITESQARARELALVNDRLQLAIHATGYGVWEMDITTRHMLWDDRMLEIYGLTRPQFSGRPDEWQSRVLPEDAPADDERINEALSGRSPIYRSTFRIARPDGSIRHIEAYGVVQRGRQGQPVRIVGLDRDVTDDTELREQLRITEERWRLALSGTNDGVWDWDIPANRVYRDARYAEIVGYATADLPGGMIWRELGHPDDIASVEHAIGEHLAGRTPIYQYEYRLRHRTGRWIWVLGRGKVVARDAAGHPLRMVGTQTDVTLRKELEERLRHGEEMSLQLGRLAQIGAWEWDLLSGKLTWSPEMFRIHEVELGFEPLLERSFTFYPPEARRTLTEAMESAVRNGTGFDLELPFISARARNLWVRVQGRAQMKEGRATRIYGAFQDITGRRDAEEMRRQLESQLFQAQKMETLGTLAGGIAHDFNNLLTGILGYQDLALEAIEEPDACRNYLGSSREASMRARELVDQILTFSRQTGSEKVPVNLAQVIEEARRFLRATVPSNIRMEIDVGTDCGRVLADSTQLHQVLLNLGSNAAHALRATGGTIRLALAQVSLDSAQLAALHAKLPPGDYARIEFSDNGTGIDEDTRKRIFDPFFTTKDVGQGTGLGLSVAHGIMQHHRGAITVASEVGRGTTFTLLLPIAGDQPHDPPPSASPFPRGQGELIAVVDDEDVVRGFAQLALERNGYRVRPFDTPTECLEEMRRDPRAFRVLLTDQTMPVMRGIELASELRTFAPDLPVVIMSGYFSHISPAMLAKLGRVSLLSKPFTIEELARAIHRALPTEAPPES
jgi:PAS domain S-box-containing protein